MSLPGRIKICGMTPDEISELISPLGGDSVRAVKIALGIYRKQTRELLKLPGLSLKLLQQLSLFAETGIEEAVSLAASSDGSIKYLFSNNKGMEYEAVFMPDGKRKTACISTQSGCRMNCSFCGSARYGFRGNLSAGEMINQLISIPQAASLTHVVLMGMGEPMDNLDAVLKTCNIVTAEWGLAFSPRNVTVSTVGISPAVNEFLRRSSCNLTLSLHTPFPDERQLLVPAERRYPVLKTIEMIASMERTRKRRFSLAYVMISGVNDSERHLEGLRSLMKGRDLRLNLIPYHPTGCDSMLPSADDRLQHFKHELIISGIEASVRKSRGADISAACGMLAAKTSFSRHQA